MASCVDVIIVNWNSGAQLRTCVESLLVFGDGLIAKIIVVDNDSKDGSVDFLFKVPSVTLIRADRNMGFGRACNVGACEASSNYLLFLNPDTRVMPEALRIVCDYMNSEAATFVGICGVKLVDEQGRIHRHCARFPSWLTFVGLSVGVSKLLPRQLPSHVMTEFDHKTNHIVDHVIGAFYFVRRELYLKLQGFDERYFVYLEDLDFSFRANQADWLTFYLADATVIHKGGGVSEQVKAHRLFYSLRSRILYAFKHFKRSEAWLVTILTLVVEPFPRMLRAILHVSMVEARDILSGFVMLWRDFPGYIRRAHRD